jgi:transposase
MAYRPLTDEQWEFVAWLIPEQEMGRPRTRDRAILDAILYVLSTGSRWGDLPSDFPPKSTVHKRFQVWSKSGVFEKLLKRLRKQLPESEVFHLDSALRMAKKGRFKRLGKVG